MNLKGLNSPHFRANDFLEDKETLKDWVNGGFDANDRRQLIQTPDNESLANLSARIVNNVAMKVNQKLFYCTNFVSQIMQ